MTTKKTAADDARLERIITLKAPVFFADADEPTTELTLREPYAHQVMNVHRKTADDKPRALTFLVAEMAGIAPADAAKLRVRDLGQVSRWLDEINRAALAADGHTFKDAGAASEQDPFGIDDIDVVDDAADDLAGSKEFTLLVPVSYQGRTIRTVTATEPGIEAIVQASKFKTQAEVTAGLVAGVIGEPMPVVSRMLQRDVLRIEAWIGPFVQDLMSGGIG